MEYQEFTGKTTEEAINRAEDAFDLPLNRLEVEVVSAGSSGFLGLFGSKQAVVRARPQEMTAEQQVAEVVREFTGEKEEEPAPREEPAREAASDKEGERIPKKENASGRNVGEFDERVIQNARDAAGRIVAVLDGESEITASGGERGIKIEIAGGEAGIIIGRRGQTLDAIQYLVTRIVSHQEGRPIRINIDAGGYRRRRKESLEGLAVRMAEKAQMVGRAVAVGPFNSPERRIVHMALKGREGISTISRGRGDLKKVIISPRG